MVQTHEYNVNNNTESDEELCEGVKDNDGKDLSMSVWVFVQQVGG